MTKLDKVTAERLYRDLKMTNKIGEIDYLLEGYEDIPTPADPYVMPVNTPQNYYQENSRSSRSLTRNQDRNEYRARSTSRPRSQKPGCYKYHKIGHSPKDCYTRLTCINCQYPGHHENDCRNDPWCE